MRERLAKFFFSPTTMTGLRFFSQTVHHNVPMLQSISLVQLSETIPNSDSLIRQLKERGYFTDKRPGKCNGRDALSIIFPNAKDKLFSSPVKILTDPSPVVIDLEGEELGAALVPRRFHQDVPQINTYINKLCQVLANPLAERQYEQGLPDSENVSERVHALQSGLIAYRLGMNYADVVAMLFHDISRSTHESIAHSHRCHHAESSKILSPLGPTRYYSLHHPLGKYLLHEFSTLYKKSLISPLSQNSLQQQLAAVSVSIRQLSALPAETLIVQLYKIMFMRAIDDFSKVPEKELIGKPCYYFDDISIKKILVNLFSERLNKELTKDENLQLFRQDLQSALKILSRVDYLSVPKLRIN